MRLDKYLKVTRLIKRRTIANEACDAGRILVNGKPAKSSSSVKADDELTIQFGNKTETVRIDQIIETTKKSETDQMYTIIDEKFAEDFSNPFDD